MRRNTALLLILISICISNSEILNAQDNAEGTLTVDGKTTDLKHVYFDSYKDEYTIIITNKPVAAEMIPDGLYMLSEQGKIKGLEFTVSSSSKEILKTMRKAIYFEPLWIHSINIGDVEFNAGTFTDERLEGTIKTVSDGQNEGYTFSYDVAFSVSLKEEPLVLSFSGDDDAPSKAYAKYCQAILDGNIEEFLKYIPQKNKELMPKDQDQVVLGLEFIQETMMTTVVVEKSSIHSGKAELILSGKRKMATESGKVIMIKENGIWKVEEESWSL